MPRSNGYVIYRGPSMIDGKPIVMVATGFADKSENIKTGAMIQTWILRDDLDPLAASHSGDDYSICGGCPHRGTIENGQNVGRSCYVKIWQAPLNVWRTEKRGRYPEMTGLDEISWLFQNKPVRLGSYGDPAAVPFEVIDAIGEAADFVNGYTHQWKDADHRYSKWLMASADNAGDRFWARANGYRTFRVRTADEMLGKKEIACPASKEMGHKTLCTLCKACGGKSAKAKVDIAIMAHGEPVKLNAFNARTDEFGIKKKVA